MLKKIIAAALSSVLVISTISACSQQGAMEMKFVEEQKNEYSSVVEGSALTIYVDANAKDNGDGSEAAPFKTIPEAQAKIREIKAGEGLPVGGITVFVKDGEYKITESLTFTEEDSGTEECPITYVSESEFGAKITGALLLSTEDFEPINEEEKSRLMDKSAAENIVKVDLTKYGLTSEDWGEYVVSGSHNTSAWYDEFNEAYEAIGFDYSSVNYMDTPVEAEAEVFIGDTVLECARWPNEGYITINKVLDLGTSCYNNLSVRNPEGPTIFIEDYIVERVSQWTSLDDVWTFGYISATWADSRNLVQYFDFDNSSMKLKYHEMYLNLEATDRTYCFFNIFDELDMPGEFYIDRNKGILYIYKTEDFYSERIKMSTITDDLITLNNVSNVMFKGFYLSETRGSGIVGTANNFIVDNCKICNIRFCGIDIDGNKITVQNSELCNLGTFGVSLEGGNWETLEHSENLIYNNYIHNYSRIVRTSRYAIDVRGVGSTVSHNEICDAPHQGVYWRGPYHIMEYNEVYDILKETADCGAFYGGRDLYSYGSEVRYNYIHDIGSEGAMAHGIYWDDGLSGQKAYGNLIVNSSSYAILVGGGRDCYVYNNIIVNSGDSPIHHDARMRQYTMNYHNAWFSHIPTMCEDLKPYLENDVWMKAFPEYEGLILYNSSYDGDLNDPMLVANPTGAIYNNIAYLNIPEGSFDWDDVEYFFRLEFDLADYCDLYNNEVIYNDFTDFPNWHNGDYTMVSDNWAKELIPEFEALLLEQMGRIK